MRTNLLLPWNQFYQLTLTFWAKLCHRDSHFCGGYFPGIMVALYKWHSWDAKISHRIKETRTALPAAMAQVTTTKAPQG